MVYYHRVPDCRGLLSKFNLKEFRNQILPAIPPVLRVVSVSMFPFPRTLEWSFISLLLS
jgi:hypothetical protein